MESTQLMLAYISPITTYIEEFLDQSIFLSQHTKLQIYLIRELCRFLQPRLISMTF